MSTRKGDLSEARALCWLLKKGHEVFPNWCGVGPVDIVSISQAGKVHLWDVKTVNERTWQNPQPQPTLLQLRWGVKWLYVGHDGKCHVRNPYFFDTGSPEGKSATKKLE